MRNSVNPNFTKNTTMQKKNNTVKKIQNFIKPVKPMDATRHPARIRLSIYTTAIESGARRICVCDTVGHATPPGVKNLLAHIAGVVAKTGEDVKIDWHGHRDRNLSIANTLAAIEAGIEYADYHYGGGGGGSVF